MTSCPKCQSPAPTLFRGTSEASGPCADPFHQVSGPSPIDAVWAIYHDLGTLLRVPVAQSSLADAQVAGVASGVRTRLAPVIAALVADPPAPRPVVDLPAAARLLDWLADGRAKYLLDGAPGQEDLNLQIATAHELAAILRGPYSPDGGEAWGWLPSWELDEWTRQVENLTRTPTPPYALDVATRAVMRTAGCGGQGGCEEHPDADVDEDGVCSWAVGVASAVLATRPVPSVTTGAREQAVWALCNADTDIADGGISEEHWRAANEDVDRVLAAAGVHVRDERPTLAAGLRRLTDLVEHDTYEHAEDGGEPTVPEDCVDSCPGCAADRLEHDMGTEPPSDQLDAAALSYFARVRSMCPSPQALREIDALEAEVRERMADRATG